MNDTNRERRHEEGMPQKGRFRETFLPHRDGKASIRNTSSQSDRNAVATLASYLGQCTNDRSLRFKHLTTEVLMSSVTFNSSQMYVSAQQAAQAATGAFERNSEAFGPAAASAIGLAQAASDAASATVSLSARALNEIADSGAHAANALSDLYHGAAHLVHAGVQDLEDGATSVVQFASHGLTNIEDAAKSAYDSVASLSHEAGSAVGRAASSVYDTVGDAVSSVAGYGTLAAQAISEIV